MKLITDNGTVIPLPSDFSFTMERHNGFFSQEGSATIPASLPATPELLEALGHPERLASTTPYVRIIGATLTSGTIRLTGKLIIESVQRNGQVEASFAVDDGSFYAIHAAKPLREVVGSYGRFAGATVAEMCQNFSRVYAGEAEGLGLTFFPVAVNKGDDGYLILNEPAAVHSLSQGLVWQSRIIMEGDKKMSVPDGYGLAPFLLLDHLLTALFSCCDWRLVLTDAQQTLLSSIAVLHRCADTCVRTPLSYADLVPDITVGELIEWLRCRFHIMPVFDEMHHTVSLVAMEELLVSTPDQDLTDDIEDHPQVVLGAPSRIRLLVDTSIDGATPAADTLADLVARYGYIHHVSENVWSLNDYKDCLVLRLATGDYYEVRRNLSGGILRVRIGTNAFPYDRQNTDQAEDFQAIDCMPPMIFPVDDFPSNPPASYRCLMPYLGQTVHRHTNRLGETAESIEAQPLMICRYGMYEKKELGITIRQYRYGTTQAHDPAGAIDMAAHDVGTDLLLTPEGLYQRFWHRYNELLLNGSVTLRAMVHQPASALFDIHRLKSFRGQHLLPVTSQTDIGLHPQPAESEFILLQPLANPVHDTVPTADRPTLEWKKRSDYDTAMATLASEMDSTYGAGNWNEYGERYTDTLDESVYLGTPSHEGEIACRYTRTLEVTGAGYDYSDPYNNPIRVFTRTYIVSFWFEALPIE